MKCLFKVALTALLCCSQVSSYACEAMSFVDARNNVWMAKDFMYEFGAGRVFANQRNVKKTSFSLVWNRVSWVSKFANITFNQPARDFPFSGMNEKGLAIEILWHDAQYPAEPKHKVINESQLIQYVLDMASNTNEAIELIKNVSVQRIYAYVHYMICDSTNNCKVIEYKNGNTQVIDMPSNIFRRLGNSDYKHELSQLQKMQKKSPRRYEDTFRVINENLSGNNNDIVKSVFSFYDDENGLGATSWSKWNIAYNLTQKKVWFRSYKNRDVKSLSLDQFEKECRPGTSELTGPINSSATDFAMTSFNKNINKQMLSTYDYIPPFIQFIGEKYSRTFHTCKNKRNRNYRRK